MTTNGRLSVVECYVVGLDPQDAEADFRITKFPMKADGTSNLANLPGGGTSGDRHVAAAKMAALHAAATERGPPVVCAGGRGTRWQRVLLGGAILGRVGG